MLDIDGVENVFLYIADDVRADFTPDRVANLGQYHRTIAAGIHSPTSISSILTGTYEPQHGVGDFSNVVPSDVPHLVNDPDRETAFTNSMNYVRFDRDSEIDIISETLDVDHVDADRLESIEPPFVFVERAAGGHAPFVQPGELHTGEAYWKQRGNAPRSTFGAEYRTAIETDTDWFLSRLHLLDDRDLLEDTLVVYVSDHGELLGEQGMLGHTPPIHPRHAYVPTVFIHPDVEPRRVTDPVLRHVDILPTVSSVLGLEWDAPVPMAGVDLTTTEPPGHGCTFYRTDQTTPVGEVTVAFGAAWNATGGYVFPESGPLGRAALAGYHFLEAPWSEYAIRHAPAHLYNKLRGDRTHFAPGFSEAQARRYVAEAKRLDTSTAETRRVEVPSDQLRDLGYME